MQDILPNPITNVNTEDERIKEAMAHLKQDFASFVKVLMIGAGYNEEERDVKNPTFLNILLLCIFKKSHILQVLKRQIFQELTQEENVLIEKLIERRKRLHIDSKMITILNLFDLNYSKAIKNILLSVNMSESQCDQKSPTYVSFFSKSLFFICNYVFDYELRHSRSEIYMGDLMSSSTISLITESRKYLVYCISTPFSKYAVKVFKLTNPLVKDMKNFHHELELGSEISHPLLRKVIKKTSYQNKEALLLEWAEGQSLTEYCKNKIFDLKDFFTISREIVSALSALHSNSITHMNICFDHIIYNPDTKAIKLIGYGASINFKSKLDCLSIEELHEMDLHYISPEQSGKLKRMIDYRSDFYNLGIVFFRLLTGNYPFSHNNAENLINMHIFNEPNNACDFNENIPKPVAAMISKLLQKEPEDRYKSAKGIIYDLDLMVSEYSVDEELKSVFLASHDKSEIFLLPHKLYGRSREHNEICEILGKVTPHSSQVVFVRGESGVGKSALVLDLIKPILKRKGLFLFGKYDAYWSEPYSAFLEAVRGFCAELLLKDARTVEKYKIKMLQAVGEEGRLLTNVIHNLEKVIGHQLNLPQTFGVAATSRFNYVFVKLIKAICSVGATVVLLLEDLQFCDAKSAELLSALLSEKNLVHLMIISTYRDDEVGEDHLVYDLVKRECSNFSTIDVRNLNNETVNEIVSDLCCVSPLETYSLSTYIYKKTKGNSFHVKQMLLSLYEQGSLFFCNEARSFRWKITDIDEVVAEDVLEILREKIKALNKIVQHTLITASCIGNAFPLLLLENIVRSEYGIKEALATGMIVKSKNSNSFCFIHDKIKQAAHSLIPEENKQKLFHYMGMKLWKNLSNPEREKHVYTIANLFHKSKNVMGGAQSNIEIIELFIRASRKAMCSSAYLEALKYIDAGINLIKSNSWENHYKVTLELYDEAANASYCLSKYSYMNKIIQEIAKNARSPVHMVKAFSLKIKYHNDNHCFHEAIRTAEQILLKLGHGIEISKYETLAPLEISKAKTLIERKSNKEILSIKKIKDEVYEAIVMIMNDIIDMSLFLNCQLLAFCASKIVQITFLHGLSKYSCIAFCALATSLRGEVTCYRIGQLSLTLLRRTNVKEFSPNILAVFYGVVTPFFVCIHDSIEHFYDAHKISLEVGSHLNSIVCANLYCRHLFLIGESLPKVQQDLEELEEVVNLNVTNFLCVKQAVVNLRDGNGKNPAILCGKLFDVKLFFEKEAQPFDFARGLVICCLMAYIFNDYSSAQLYAMRCREAGENFIPMTYSHAIFLFYECLSHLATITTMEEYANNELVEKSLKELKQMAETAPMNYLNKVMLVEAEISSLCGYYFKAEGLYKESISLSKSNRFPHEQALGFERQGIFYLKNKSPGNARECFAEAMRCYKIWGALTKVMQLERKISSCSNQIKPETINPFPEKSFIEKRSVASMSALSTSTFGSHCKRVRLS